MRKLKCYEIEEKTLSSISLEEIQKGTTMNNFGIPKNNYFCKLTEESPEKKFVKNYHRKKPIIKTKKKYDVKKNLVKIKFLYLYKKKIFGSSKNCDELYKDLQSILHNP
jgi:hypothetical protein